MSKANPFDPAVKAHPFNPLDFHPAEPVAKPQITYDPVTEPVTEPKLESVIDKIKDFLD